MDIDDKHTGPLPGPVRLTVRRAEREKVDGSRVAAFLVLSALWLLYVYNTHDFLSDAPWWAVILVGALAFQVIDGMARTYARVKAIHRILSRDGDR